MIVVTPLVLVGTVREDRGWRSGRQVNQFES
jgi:hypothetical protein